MSSFAWFLIVFDAMSFQLFDMNLGTDFTAYWIKTSKLDSQLEDFFGIPLNSVGILL